MPIKAIILDCFGVLVQPGRSLLYKTYPHLANEINDLEHQWHYGIISREQFDQLMGELVGVSASDVRTKFYGLNVRDEEAITWARSLKDSGQYKVGMLSNVGLDRFNEFFDPVEQSELFDAVVLSCEVGMVKPERMIYELTADRLGVKLEECIMIDDIQVNVDAANNSGMRGILFITTEQAKRDLAVTLESDHA